MARPPGPDRPPSKGAASGFILLRVKNGSPHARNLPVALRRTISRSMETAFISTETARLSKRHLDTGTSPILHDFAWPTANRRSGRRPPRLVGPRALPSHTSEPHPTFGKALRPLFTSQYIKLQPLLGLPSQGPQGGKRLLHRKRRLRRRRRRLFSHARQVRRLPCQLLLHILQLSSHGGELQFRAARAKPQTELRDASERL